MSKKEIDEDLYNDLMDAEHDREEMRRQYVDFQAEKRKFEQGKKKENSSELLNTIGKLLTDTSSSSSYTSPDDSRYSREIERLEEEQERLEQESAERERKYQEELRNLEEKQKQAERDAYYNYLNWHLDDDEDDYGYGDYDYEDDYEEFTDTYDNINKEYGNYSVVEEEPDVFTDMAPLSPEDKAKEQEYISNAVAMTEDGAFAQAKNEYNKALKINPNNYRAIFGIAKCEVKFKYDTGCEIPYDVDDKYGKLAKNMRLSVLEKSALKAKQALSHSDASEEEKIRFLNGMAITIYIASFVFAKYFITKTDNKKHGDDYWDEYHHAKIDSVRHLEFAFGIISDLDDELSKTNVIKIKNQICNIYASYTYDNPGYYYLTCYKKYRDEIKGKITSESWYQHTEANPFSNEASKKMSYDEKQAAIKEFWEKVDEAEKDGGTADLNAIVKEIEDRIIHKKEKAERRKQEKEKQAQQEKEKKEQQEKEKQEQLIIEAQQQAEEIQKKEQQEKEKQEQLIIEAQKQAKEIQIIKNIFLIITSIIMSIISLIIGVNISIFGGIILFIGVEIIMISIFFKWHTL